MSRATPLRRIPVGIVVERRRATSPWTDFIWRAAAVLPGVPKTAPWTALEDDAVCMRFYGGPSAIELFRSDTAGYRDNLAGEAKLWVVLRPTDSEPPYEVAAVTADPGEGEAFSESPVDLVEAVAMPESVRDVIAEFVREHHVEHQFVKRTRSRVDPEALARRPAAKRDQDDR